MGRRSFVFFVLELFLVAITNRAEMLVAGEGSDWSSLWRRLPQRLS